MVDNWQCPPLADPARVIASCRTGTLIPEECRSYVAVGSSGTPGPNFSLTQFVLHSNCLLLGIILILAGSK